ncbi:Ulp1 protease family, C-terminal catalytic domain [Sesbania bispinosa]|nr:Ulp1 protease family, C-terminal catalytic domain [Sesbania bispinosa]
MEVEGITAMNTDGIEGCNLENDQISQTKCNDLKEGNGKLSVDDKERKKILNWMEDGKTPTVNLSDYEDLDDYEDEEHANIMMDVSEEEAPPVDKKQKVKKHRVKRAATKNKTENEGIKGNNFGTQKRKSTTEDTSVANRKRGANKRKLFHTPSPSNIGDKEGVPKKTNQVESSGLSSIGISTIDCIGKTLPKTWKSRFTVTTEMGLTMDELQVATYIFSLEAEFKEVIFKQRNARATIRELDCLCPGKIVEDEIIRLMAMRNTWRQLNVNVQIVWTLPPSFSEAILDEQSKENIAMTYIYVPIKEISGHWYLMVVAMESQIVYHLDCYPQVSKLKERRDNITKVCEVLVFLMTSEWLPCEFVNPPHDIDTWEIKGITPNQDNNHSTNSALWVLDWMAMDYAFQPNLHGVINEKKVRMKTVMALLLGSHNELRKNLEARAEMYFHNHVDNAKTVMETI